MDNDTQTAYDTLVAVIEASDNDNKTDALRTLTSVAELLNNPPIPKRPYNK